MVEHSAVNRVVVGSSPTTRAKFNKGNLKMYNDLSERISKAVMILLAIAIVFGVVVGGLIGYVIY